MTHHLQIILSTALAAGLAVSVAAQIPSQLPSTPVAIPDQTSAIPLYPASKQTEQIEQWRTAAGQRSVTNVVMPSLTPVLPDPAKATGLGVIVVPGGGFRLLAIDNEGYEPARWLADHGIAAFVLKYRLTPMGPGPNGGGMPPGGPGGPGGPGMPPGAAGGRPGQNGPPGGPGGEKAPPATVQDARTALQIVRSRAAEWKVDPNRVGLLGFSAGSIITLEIGLGEESAGRPKFIAPIYGPLSARDVPDDAPPMFAALASDDPIMGPRGIDLISQYRKAGKSVEFHLFETGGHAFGMKKQGKTSDLWIDEFFAWLKDRGLLEPVSK